MAGFSLSDTFNGMNINDTLREKNKSISQSVAGFTNQAINPIKSTISDLQSGIALVKDSEKGLMDQLFGFKSTVIDGLNDYMGALTGGKMSIADFGNVISFRDGFNIDSDELMRIAGKTMGFNIGSIATIKEDLASEFLSELNSMTMGLSDGLFQVDGGKVNIAGDWDKSIGDSVFGFLDMGSSNFKTVNNFAGSNAVLNTMVKQNASIGFVEGFKGFESMYLYESDYQAAILSTIPVLLNRGDLLSLQEVLSILNETSLYTAKSLYPNFAETILANFNLPKGTLPEDHITFKDILLEIIVKVSGNNWSKTSTHLGWLTNVGLVSSISADSKTVLLREPSLIPLLCLSGIIPKEPAIDKFVKDFPDAILL